MKDLIINNSIYIIKKYNNYDQVKLEEIRYGLVSIYLLVSKLLFIAVVAWYFGIFKEFIITALIYNIIRMPSYGIHASKSWICLVVSTLIFIIVPLLSINLIIPTFIKSTLGIICVIIMYSYSPADTHKKPIINKNRRLVYKYCSVSITATYIFLSIFINNTFLQNTFIFTAIIQSIVILPITYKIFNMPYNNYLKYINNGLN